MRSPRSCEATPLKAAPTVVCARTSLAVTTRAMRMRARFDLTPHRVASARLAAHERREGLA